MKQAPIGDGDGVSVAKVKHLLDCGELEQASSLCSELQSASPNNWRVERLKWRIALERGHFAEAAEHIAHAEVKGAPPIVLKKMGLNLGRKSGIASDEIQALQALCGLEPCEPKWFRQLFSTQIAAGKNVAAIETLERLLETDPDTDLRFRETLNLFKDTSPARALDMLARCLEQAPDHHIIRAVRATILFDSGESNAAMDDLTVALSSAPAWGLPWLLHSKIEAHLGESDSAFVRLQALQAEFPRNPSLLWIVARGLNMSGEVERSYKFITDNWSWASDHGLPAWFLGDLESYRGPAGFGRLIGTNQIDEAQQIAQGPEQTAFVAEAIVLPETPTEQISQYSGLDDVTIYGPGRRSGVVLTFGGLRGVPGVHPAILDRFFGALDLTQVILSDQARMLYLKGVRGLGSSFQETSAALTDLISGLPGKAKVYTFANSGGTLGSICYAQAIGARASLVFSPIATCDPKYKDVIGDKRAGIILRRLIRDLDLRQFDLETILARTDPAYRVSSYVSANHPVGLAHGEMLDKMARVSTTYLSGENSSPLLLATHQFGLMAVLREAFAIT